MKTILKPPEQFFKVPVEDLSDNGSVEIQTFRSLSSIFWQADKELKQCQFKLKKRNGLFGHKYCVAGAFGYYQEPKQQHNRTWNIYLIEYHEFSAFNRYLNREYHKDITELNDYWHWTFAHFAQEAEKWEALPARERGT